MSVRCADAAAAQAPLAPQRLATVLAAGKRHTEATGSGAFKGISNKINKMLESGAFVALQVKVEAEAKETAKRAIEKMNTEQILKLSEHYHTKEKEAWKGLHAEQEKLKKNPTTDNLKPTSNLWVLRVALMEAQLSLARLAQFRPHTDENTEILDMPNRPDPWFLVSDSESTVWTEGTKSWRRAVDVQTAKRYMEKCKAVQDGFLW